MFRLRRGRVILLLIIAILSQATSASHASASAKVSSSSSSSTSSSSSSSSSTQTSHASASSSSSILVQCRKNEVYTDCKRGCPPDTCDTLYLSYLCAAEQQCEPGCVCASGYLRTNHSDTGECVHTDRCLPEECVNDPNAVRGCGDRCGKTCRDYKNTTLNCLNRACNVNGCECRKGYVYDEEKHICVKPKECPLQCTGPHERYTSCYLGECVAKTCDELGYPIACPRLSRCDPGCICEEGYVRNGTGYCIEKNQCPSCRGDKNAVSGCGNHCGKSCSDYQRKDIACAEYCELNGCDCKERFVFDDKKQICVKPKDCSTTGGNVTTCSDPNEVYTDCLEEQCGPKTCDDLGYPITCGDAKYCTGGCICKDGYVKDSSGKCINKKQCPKCGGDSNATSGCGNPCGKTCDDRNRTEPVFCPQYCLTNGCDCRKGYLLDTKKGKCVLIKDCPPLQTNNNNTCTGVHEVYSNCTEANCAPKTCKNVGYPVACPSVSSCSGGCICESGYVRDKSGTCIQMGQCSSCGGDPNAMSGCGSNCGRKCSDLNRTGPLACPQSCLYNGCDCKDGFWYNTDLKRCVTKEECSVNPNHTCPANQTWQNCHVKCPNFICPTRDGAQPVCDAPNPCPSGCGCALNYKYESEDSDNCIAVSDCPPLDCQDNQVFDYCPSPCLAENCADKDNQPTTCNTFAPVSCEPKCVCKENHFRNDEGKCVPYDQCPSQQQCPANQTWQECHVRCPDTICPKSDGPQPLCSPPNPCPSGCGCKLNFKYENANSNKCIAVKDCKPFECGKNQVYEYCPSPCLAEECADKDNQPAACNTFAPVSCQPKCICAKNYFRNEDRECVPYDECPKPCPTNQTWQDCNFKCPPQAYCPTEDDGITILCRPPNPCPPGCGCAFNYRIDSNTGNCVLATDCPEIECVGPYERYDKCPSPCLAESCDNKDDLPAACNTLLPTACEPQCVCQKNHFRNSNGTCVPYSECPATTTPAAE